jgi:prepilin-type N-terminal cleavage/methylation domain-containing protein
MSRVPFAVGRLPLAEGRQYNRITAHGPGPTAADGRGFTLLEIMLVVILLSVAMTSATWVFRSSLLMLHQSQRSAGAVGRLATAVEMMHRDVADAQTVEVRGQELTARMGDGQLIRWYCGKGTWKREVAGKPTRQWTGLPPAMMTQEKAGVMLLWPDAPLHAGGRAWMEATSWKQ